MSFLSPAAFFASFQSNAHNLSFYTIPAAWALAIAPHFYAVSLSKGKFTNSSPRQYLADIIKKENKTADDKKYVRAEAANANGFENLAFFASAVIAGNIAGVPAHELNALSFGYLFSRAIFNYLYITVEDETKATLRSASFLAGIGMIFTLFIRAGNKAF
ncbi:uncharacterized protein PFL1_06311 [Pseudozyma flocculosa PF-1]|uniref:Uncharacterized protein n=2 Tax=Pseudozyma flocculosa TaxID=84751 RepID=A0A5C3F7A0_9BASI|nr:uncharacterized protein PFL1_06311 [Pseudozyma flocculosa PF-1]EPQ26103.1 hypothetical protein PFL1_06311 [Pseudozyma flocculosa PF-1]SPO40348.1 uncharacterized protein PSFLO_05830 [Pseudozyma flocculosa]